MEVSTVVWGLYLSLSALCVWLGQAGRCEKITVHYCRGLWYNFTSMPNAHGHETQHDVHLELLYLREIVQARCSPHARRFLCAMFLPRCSWTNTHAMRVEQPCRQDCEIVKNGCESFLARSGSTWSHFLSCDRLPVHTCLRVSAPAAPSIDIIVSRDPPNTAPSRTTTTSGNCALLTVLQIPLLLSVLKWL